MNYKDKFKTKTKKHTTKVQRKHSTITVLVMPKAASSKNNLALKNSQEVFHST